MPGNIPLEKSNNKFKTGQWNIKSSYMLMNAEISELLDLIVGNINSPDQIKYIKVKRVSLPLWNP